MRAISAPPPGVQLPIENSAIPHFVFDADAALFCVANGSECKPVAIGLWRGMQDGIGLNCCALVSLEMRAWAWGGIVPRGSCMIAFRALGGFAVLCRSPHAVVA